MVGIAIRLVAAAALADASVCFVCQSVREFNHSVYTKKELLCNPEPMVQRNRRKERRRSCLVTRLWLRDSALASWDPRFGLNEPWIPRSFFWSFGLDGAGDLRILEDSIPRRNTPRKPSRTMHGPARRAKSDNKKGEREAGPIWSTVAPCKGAYSKKARKPKPDTYAPKAQPQT